MGECDLLRFFACSGNALRQLLHETPVFMRVLENPVVRNNAAWEGPKSMGKRWFSTIFLGFCAHLARNCRF
jgi:hypothetical protein